MMQNNDDLFNAVPLFFSMDEFTMVTCVPIPHDKAKRLFVQTEPYKWEEHKNSVNTQHKQAITSLRAPYSCSSLLTMIRTIRAFALVPNWLITTRTDALTCWLEGISLRVKLFEMPDFVTRTGANDTVMQVYDMAGISHPLTLDRHVDTSLDLAYKMFHITGVPPCRQIVDNSGDHKSGYNGIIRLHTWIQSVLDLSMSPHRHRRLDLHAATGWAFRRAHPRPKRMFSSTRIAWSRSRTACQVMWEAVNTCENIASTLISSPTDNKRVRTTRSQAMSWLYSILECLPHITKTQCDRILSFWRYDVECMPFVELQFVDVASTITSTTTTMVDNTSIAPIPCSHLRLTLLIHPRKTMMIHEMTPITFELTQSIVKRIHNKDDDDDDHHHPWHTLEWGRVVFYQTM